MFQSGVSGHICDVIYFIINVILSNLLMTIMNNAVSYSLRFVEYMLHMSKGSFFFQKLSHFISFSSIILFLNDEYIFIKICPICLVLKSR